METAKAFVLALLILVLVAVVAIIALNELSDGITGTSGYAEFANYTTETNFSGDGSTAVNIGGLNVSHFPDCAVTVTSAVNYSSDAYVTIGNIGSGNWTTSGCTITSLGTLSSTGGENTSFWNVSGYLTYDAGERVGDDVSTGITNFFSDVDTWFALISVIIIILIIAVVIIAVNRFGGSATSGSAFAGGGKSDVKGL